MLRFIFLFAIQTTLAVDITQFSSTICEVPPYNYILEESDDPLVSSTSFRMLCNHRIDYETTDFKPDHVQKGDTIFVAYHLLIPFVEHIHPKITCPYILVTNESTANHPPAGTEALIYDSKCAAWFSKNMILSNHPKLFQIPVGQTCFEWAHIKPYLPDLIQLGLQSHSKEFTAFLRIENTFLPTRKEALNVLRDKPFIHYINQEIPLIDYYDYIASSKFVVAPLGGGYDTCRFWESLWLKSIPITTHSPLDALYDDVPCIILDSWSDLNTDVLLEKNDEIMRLLSEGKLSFYKANFNFWKERIADVQEKIRGDLWQNAELAATLLSSYEIEVLKSAFKATHSKDMFVIGKCLSMRCMQYLNAFSSYENITMLDEYFQNIENYFTHTKLTTYLDPHLDYTCNVIHNSQVPVHIVLDLTYYHYEFEAQLEKIWESLPVNSMIAITNAQNSYIFKKTTAILKKLKISRYKHHESLFFLWKT